MRFYGVYEKNFGNKFQAYRIDGRNPNSLGYRRHWQLYFHNAEEVVETIKTCENLWGKSSESNSWHYAYSNQRLSIFLNTFPQCDEIWTMMNLSQQVEA